MDDFPARVRDARERMKMTRAQFAKLLAVSEKTVQNWERGESTPRNRMGALRRYLDPSPEAAREGNLAAVEQRVRDSGLFSGAHLDKAIALAQASWVTTHQNPTEGRPRTGSDS